MPSPKSLESRKRIARAVVALAKLPPEKRREILHAEMKRRGLTPRTEAPDAPPSQHEN